jgi:hypothetical protein
MFLLQITMVVCVLTLAVCGSDREAAAQTMVTTTTPLQANSESFFESSGVGWSVRRPGFFASFNSGGPIPPPFGGFNPQASFEMARGQATCSSTLLRELSGSVQRPLPF